MTSLESECLSLIEQNNEEFSYSLQKYKLHTLATKEISSQSDSIFGYFLLYLLAKGQTKRYSLNRLELSDVIDINKSECIKTVDHIWRCSILGDIPQMKHALDALPKTHLKIGLAACEFLQERKGRWKSAREEGRKVRFNKLLKHPICSSEYK
ncbi:hypothetical protein NERG_01196 [Nematocida ausubeli]|uniref:Uncharacterized protein n=1 Tax=Nematocida ausubeli (strain ATCC PRA-371 / ERTm2) TaxID=1913371 RepID=H8ZBV3_NEMA1|nr:hypothetical protein NERG_01196 [Nematocida ausubeli]